MQAHDNDGELFYHLQHQVYPWHKTNLLLETIRHNSDINQSALCVSPVTTVKCSLSGFVSGLNAIIKSGWIIPELPSKKYYCNLLLYFLSTRTKFTESFLVRCSFDQSFVIMSQHVSLVVWLSWLHLSCVCTGCSALDHVL